MKERIKQLINQSYLNVQSQNGRDITYFDKEYFAELIVRECIDVASKQRNPSTLNFKPSERFVEDLKQHFGVQ